MSSRLLCSRRVWRYSRSTERVSHNLRPAGSGKPIEQGSYDFTTCCPTRSSASSVLAMAASAAPGGIQQIAYMVGVVARDRSICPCVTRSVIPNEGPATRTYRFLFAVSFSSLPLPASVRTWTAPSCKTRESRMRSFDSVSSASSLTTLWSSSTSSRKSPPGETALAQTWQRCEQCCARLTSR